MESHNDYVEKISRSNIRLPTRLESVKIGRSPRTRINPCYGSQLHRLNPARIVADSGQVGILDSVDPYSQSAVSNSGCTRCSPIRLDVVDGIADIKPGSVAKGGAVIAQACPDLVTRA